MSLHSPTLKHTVITLLVCTSAVSLCKRFLPKSFTLLSQVMLQLLLRVLRLRFSYFSCLMESFGMRSEAESVLPIPVVLTASLQLPHRCIHNKPFFSLSSLHQRFKSTVDLDAKKVGGRTENGCTQQSFLYSSR